MKVPWIAACAACALLASPACIPLPASAALLAAPAEIPLRAPAGWTSTTAQGATVMKPGDLAEGKTYTAFLTPLQTKAGSLDEVYEVAKKLLGEVGAYTEVAKPQKAQSDGGWEYSASIGILTKDGNGLLAQLTALKKGDTGGVLIVIADSIETLQKYSDPFTEMVRSLGGLAKPPPAPDAVKASGSVDLQYAVPAGWTESKKAGATVIEAVKDDFYTKYRWTIVVMPSQPLTGSLRDEFREYWKALVTANYDSDTVPLPLVTRLGDGQVCAYDADGSAKHKASGARPRTVGVYLLARGSRFVPILTVLYGHEVELEKALNQFIASARVPGAAGANAPLFTGKDLAGDWSEGSSSIASYVTASGAYAGDASIYTGTSLHLRTDGTYSRVFIGITANRRLKETDEGKWTIDQDHLVLSHPKGVDRYSLFGFGTDPKAGRFLVLGTYANVKGSVSLSNPRGPFQASWYKAK